MAKGKSSKSVVLPSEQPPKIYKALLGIRGRVHRGDELTFEEAVVARRAGLDVVVSGGKPEETRRIAREIETSANGPQPLADPHHGSPDEDYLPHFHANQQRIPRGHCFHETHRRKAF